MEDVANIIGQLLQYSIQNIMIKTSDISVNITGYLLREINIHRCMEISEHSMLALLVFNDISIHTKKVEVVHSFMISDDVYMTHLLNILKMKVIENIKL